MATFPAHPLKFRTAGFPQYGFKQEFNRDLQRLSPPYTRPQLRSRRKKVGPSPLLELSPIRPLFASRLRPPPPEALGSEAGYIVPPPLRLLRPHPPRSTAPPFSFIMTVGLVAQVPLTLPRPSGSLLLSPYPYSRAVFPTPVARGGLSTVDSPSR